MQNTTDADFEQAFKAALRPQVDQMVSAVQAELKSQGVTTAAFELLMPDASVESVENTEK